MRTGKRVQFITRHGLIRMALGLGALGALAIAAKHELCDCGPDRPGMNSPSIISVDNLRRHVHYLAGKLGERNVWRPGTLPLAADYLEREWRAQGYAVQRLPYSVHNIECHNLEITKLGASRPQEIIVVGAHYDSVDGSPGANDNGSGVAALLELSRVFADGSAGAPPARTIRFVAFVNEEPPFFETGQQGSAVYAQAARQQGLDIRAMIALETMGCFSDEAGSQKFPAPLFKFFYPARGNFIAFVSNLKSRAVMRRAAGGFRGRTTLPLECCAMFEWVAGIGWSDHAPFWRAGYPALMVTDTAPFRYDHYHAPQDTPDKVHYAKLAQVTDGLAGALMALANDLP